jgi:ABC-type nitrate/sulfonate/bicarbonate transport system substrate-binding protein
MSQTVTPPGIRHLWYTRCPAPTPLGIAIQQGRLKQEFANDGFDIKALQDSADPTIRQSHYTHSQPHSFRQGGNIPALWARSQGTQTRVIGVTWVDEFQGLISLPSSGVQTPADLKGRRFGLPRNTHATVVDFHRATALRGFTSLLDAAGLSLEDVQLVELDDASRNLSTRAPVYDQGPRLLLETERAQEFSREALALVRQEADVVFVKGATGLEAANLIGARVIIDLSAQQNRLLHANNGNPRPLTVDAGLLQERPDVVARVLACAIEAGEWASANAADARAYIARETRTAEHWVRHAYPADLHLQLKIDLDQRDIAAFDNFKHFLLERAFIPNDFDIAAWIDPAPLQAARQLLSARRLVAAA